MKCNFFWLLRAALLAAACFISPAFAQTQVPMFNSYPMAWDEPTTNEDGTPLTDLAGYYIYMGDTPQTMIPYYFTGSLQQIMFLAFPAGTTHYFGITAVNVEGVESTMSAIIGR